MTAAAKLPELNERVTVILDDERQLSTRVEGVEEAALLVAPPSDRDGVTYLLAAGDHVAVEWTTERGLFHGDGRVTGRTDAGVPLLRIDLDESSVIQRREFVRVECGVAIELRFRGDRIQATSLDLSGAGVRLLAKVQMAEDDVATLLLYLPDGPPIETRAHVVRVDGENVYAFQFLGLDSRVQERIIRWVFAAHRRAHAMVRRSA